VFALGCSAVAILFCAYLVAFGDVARIVESIPHILNDYAHPRVSVAQGFLSFARSYLKGYGPYMWVCRVAWMVLTVVCLIDKKRLLRKNVYCVLVCVLAMVDVAVIMFSGQGLGSYSINLLCCPVQCGAVVIWLLCEEEKRLRNVFLFILVAGFGYQVMINLTSNQGFYAISWVSLITTIGCMLLLHRFAKGKIGMVSVVGLSVLLVACMGYLRYEKSFWDVDIEDQDTKVEFGYAKGIVVNGKARQEICDRVNRFSRLDGRGKGGIFIFPSEPSNYLILERPMSSHASWIDRSCPGVSWQKSMVYFSLNPEKLPADILVDPSCLQKDKPDWADDLKCYRFVGEIGQYKWFRHDNISVDGV